MIGIDFDQIFAEIKRIQRDMKQFPAASEVARSVGGETDATRNFRNAVELVAQGMGTVTENSIVALNEANEAIRLAVTEIAEQDAALADETKLIVSLLDSATEQASAGPQTPSGQQAASQSEEPQDADY